MFRTRDCVASRPRWIRWSVWAIEPNLWDNNNLLLSSLLIFELWYLCAFFCCENSQNNHPYFVLKSAKKQTDICRSQNTKAIWIMVWFSRSQLNFCQLKFDFCLDCTSSEIYDVTSFSCQHEKMRTFSGLYLKKHILCK